MDSKGKIIEMSWSQVTKSVVFAFIVAFPLLSMVSTYVIAFCAGLEVISVFRIAVVYWFSHCLLYSIFEIVIWRLGWVWVDGSSMSRKVATGKLVELGVLWVVK